MSFNSSTYWEKRYHAGGNSGDGSYGHLATFKSKIINSIINQHNIKSVVDYGVGDGNQCELIDTQNIQYYGIDVSPTAIQLCVNRKLKDKQFMLVEEYKNKNIQCELSISCDVIYHLIEDDVFEEYMQNLFDFSIKYVIIYSRNENVNHAKHVKFRKFSNYIESNIKANLIDHILNPYPQTILGSNNKNTSPSDFFVYEKVI